MISPADGRRIFSGSCRKVRSLSSNGQNSMGIQTNDSVPDMRTIRFSPMSWAELGIRDLSGPFA